MPVRAELTEDRLDPGVLLRAFVAGCDEAGAVVSFCGLARGRSGDGAEVSYLDLHHHPRLTLPSLEAAAREAATRFDADDVLVVHRCGTIAPRETIVFVAAAARHRRAAFLAADFLMDRLKTEAVFWKKERGVDGPRWIEPTEEDRAALARWER